ncbi:MAG: hypothetical protein ACTSRL_17040 [Candidatus Helarchaeota archaeon]
MAFLFALGGAFQFIILISLATVFYAGGNAIDPSVPGYSIWDNSWSDLGRTIAWSGKSNFTAQILFSFAMILWGVSFAPSIHALSTSFSNSRKGALFGKTATFCAYLCAFTLISEVIFFPEDLQPGLHRILAAVGYGTLFLVEIFLAIAILLEPNYLKRYAVWCLIVAVIIFIFFLDTEPIVQKSVSLSLIIATFAIFSKYDKIFQSAYVLNET